MHELSIALSLIDVAAEEADRRGVHVVAIHLQLGPLSGVVREALSSAFELAREGSPLADARLSIREMPIVVRCGPCGSERTIPSVQHLCCPVCGTSCGDVISGRELEVVGLEVIDDPANAIGGSPAESAQAE